MRYQSFNFTDSYSNASGSRREAMALGELGKVINEQPQAVIEAMREADVNISPSSTSSGIAKIIHKNKSNKNMVRNLSALVFLNSKFEEGYSFLGKKKNKGGATSTDPNAKTGLFKKVGNWFANRKKNKASKDPNAKKNGLGSQIGTLLNDNKDEIKEIGGGLLGGLFSSGGGSTLQQQSVTPYQAGFGANSGQGGNMGKKPMSLGVKIAIGVGILGVLGLGIYLIRRKK